MMLKNLCILLFLSLLACQPVKKGKVAKAKNHNYGYNNQQSISGWLIPLKGACVLISCKSNIVFYLIFDSSQSNISKYLQRAPLYQPVWVKLTGAIKNKSNLLKDVPYKGNVLRFEKQIVNASAYDIDTESKGKCAAKWPFKAMPVLYTAFGFEPGWRANISPNAITLISNYGKNKERFEKIQRRQKGETIIFSGTNTHGEVLKITFKHANCTAPSGKKLPYHVSLSINNKKLKGCGKPILKLAKSSKTTP